MAGTRTGRRKGGPKSAGITYSALSLAILVILGALTLTAATTAPPAIAELAPQAVQQIKDAPQEQSSELGSAAGGAATGEATSTTTTTAALEGGGPAITTTTLPPIERARVRRCVGDPPRQTEDPQSPPCVPFWEGDNGGATTRGVTATQINLAMGGGDPADIAKTAKIYEDYFNKRFEFYGRRLNIIPIDSGDGPDCAEQKARAVDAVSMNLFGVTDTASFGTMCFHHELARQKVVNAMTNVLFSEAELAEQHPYLWQYIMGHEKLFASIGEMVCARLAGGNAEFSGDPLFRANPRKFGVVLQVPVRDGEISLQPLERAMAACGATLEEKVIVPDKDDQYNQIQDAVLKMRTKNISTVICLCLIFREAYFSPISTSHGYFPEWILSSYFTNDYNILVKLFWTQEHRKSIFGVTAAPRARLEDIEPAAYAAKEVAPDVRYLDIKQALNAYRTLLLLSSGIQMAGPNLTPETFAKALQTTRFPNPPDPTGSGAVGFLDRDHTMTEDLAEMWWSEAAVSPEADGSPGAYCYIDNAARRIPRRWPKGPAAWFQPPCDSGA